MCSVVWWVRGYSDVRGGLRACTRPVYMCVVVLKCRDGGGGLRGGVRVQERSRWPRWPRWPGGYVGQLQSILRRCLRGQWLRASVEVRVARPDSASEATIGVQGWKGQRQGTDGLDNGAMRENTGPYCWPANALGNEVRHPTGALFHLAMACPVARGSNNIVC